MNQGNTVPWFGRKLLLEGFVLHGVVPENIHTFPKEGL